MSGAGTGGAGTGRVGGSGVGAGRVGIAAAAAGLLLGLVAAFVLPALPLPVTADLRGPGGPAAGDRVLLPVVAGRVALLVPAALTLVALALRRPASAVAHRLVAVGAAAPIAVFLVAQLNGVRDLGALVLTYAATAGIVLVRSVPGRWPWSIAAMLGIVPWGVIAFHQVGAAVVGTPVPPGVAAVTLLVLVLTIAEFVQGRDPARAGGLLVALPPALLAAGSLLL